MKPITVPQMNLLIRLSGEKSVKVEEVHTITLASTLRRGLIQPVRRRVKLTALGRETYKFNMNRRYLAWKEQLSRARNMKRRAA